MLAMPHGRDSGEGDIFPHSLYSFLIHNFIGGKTSTTSLCLFFEDTPYRWDYFHLMKRSKYYMKTTQSWNYLY